MTKRSYRQNCSLAYGSDLLGERWTSLILRELLIQPRRFNELCEYLKGIGTNLLAERLKQLESCGLIEKQDPDSRRSAYRLTDLGYSSEPVLLEMIRFGFRIGGGDEDYLHCDHWDLLAMKAFFDAKRCRKKQILQFRSDTLIAWAQVSPSGFTYAVGEHQAPDIVVESNALEFQTDLAAGKYQRQKDIVTFADCFVFPETSR